MGEDLMNQRRADRALSAGYRQGQEIARENNRLRRTPEVL
jgi:hypothetical protein